MDAVRHNERADVKARLELEIDGAVDQRHLEDLLAQRALVRQGMDTANVEKLRQQMERAMARRIHPHYVHDFFIEAFKRLGGKVNPREKGRYEITYVPPLLMDRNQQIGIGLPVQPRYERICFEKEHVSDSPRAELVSPGHPLLEACISLVMERDGSVLGQGLSWWTSGISAVSLAAVLPGAWPAGRPQDANRSSAIDLQPAAVPGDQPEWGCESCGVCSLSRLQATAGGELD